MAKLILSQVRTGMGDMYCFFHRKKPPRISELVFEKRNVQSLEFRIPNKYLESVGIM